ncbi:MarR family winged helix-turn-helix transcriptional regulator [Oryzifoliimicrobium ureilyticus]|uniref:MarR family winged helix-turn-helix transcriptional regulator n=1 Tax=Oryzifoliimicrobium ureilyticus TaxID=3113724 RepID=UPI0030763223
MPNKLTENRLSSVGHWTKRCYLAGRAAMEAMLRPYDLGATQWYVLYHLANDGPSMQRDLVKTLQIERATLSGIVAVLVRKGLVEQIPDNTDQRQKLLRMTPAGAKLWDELPDLAVINALAFDGLDEAAVAAAIEVLKTATERLEQMTEGK